MTDSDNGVSLAVLRYRLPGAADFTTLVMKLANGTGNDGVWEAGLGTGEVAGGLELCLGATDGETDARSPAAGCHRITLVKPEGPSLEVSAPGEIALGSSPEVKAAVSDAGGVVGVQARFRLNGEGAYRTVEMTRRSGDARQGEWAASLPPADATGRYNFSVVARNSRSDNSSGERTIKVLPDLYVSSVTISKKHPVVKDRAVIRAVLGNRGDRAVTGLTVQFLDLAYSVGDLRHIGQLENVTVPPNAEVKVSADWTPQADGARELAVVLNPDRKVEEWDAENDELATTVEVGLEPGMGTRFPMPTLGDIWIQLTLVSGAAILVGGKLYLGVRALERKRAPAAGRPRDGEGKGKAP
jgi:hypothetical protein